jgi:cephalosporin hydroxylase
VPCLKCPLDLWIYQEILWEVRPDLVIETGTHLGGSALFLAGVMDAIGHGEVVSIDTAARARPAHPRIRYLQGSSTDDATLARVGAEAAASRLVVLDSDHDAPHVAREIALYAPLVTVGSYLIVEDTNLNGNPASPAFGPGPREAVAAFLRESDAFEIDRSREKFLMTFNPGGYLKRVR